MPLARTERFEVVSVGQHADAVLALAGGNGIPERRAG